MAATTTTFTELTPTIIAKEALMQLENMLVFAKLVHTQYKKEFVKIGDTVTIRKPVKFIANSGADITQQIQDITEDSTTLTIDKRFNVAWEFSTADLTLVIEEYSKRYILPAMIVLANKVDYTLAALYKDLFWNAGTPGTTPDSFKKLGNAAKMLDKAAVPREGRQLVVDPDANWELADALKGLFDPTKVRGFIENGYLATLAGMGIYTDQNIIAHTAGSNLGTPVVKGAAQSGASLITDGWTINETAVMKDGDIFTVDDVYAVNPVEKTAYSYLQPFVVTADQDSDGSGDSTLAISPSIVLSTDDPAHQNVSAGPADGAAITVTPSHTANMAFHKNCLGLVTVPLELPDGCSFKARESHQGLSIRVLKDFDIKTDKEMIRLDIMFGVKTLYPELGCRLMG